MGKIFLFSIYRVQFKRVRTSFKMACTSGPFFDKIMKRYHIFPTQINYYQIDQMHK